MRVLQLGPYPPPHGGVQTNLVAIREYLTARGIDNAVVNLTRHRKEETGEIYYPRTPVELIGLVARLPHDVLHLHLGGDLTRRLQGLSLACCWRPVKKAILTSPSDGYAGCPSR